MLRIAFSQSHSAEKNHALQASRPRAMVRPGHVRSVNRSGPSGGPQAYAGQHHHRATSRRGGIFLDRTPAEITRAGLETCLKSANMLASDRNSADFLLTVYLFNFGLSDSSGMDFFGKVEFAATLKNPKTAKSQQVTASGTSIAGVAVRKKNIQKNVQEDIERAFADALRNLLRGVKLRDAVVALDLPADTPATPAQAPAAAPATPAAKKPSVTGPKD